MLYLRYICVLVEYSGCTAAQVIFKIYLGYIYVIFKLNLCTRRLRREGGRKGDKQTQKEGRERAERDREGRGEGKEEVADAS